MIKQYLYGVVDTLTGKPGDISVIDSDAEFIRGFAQQITMVPAYLRTDLKGVCYGEILSDDYTKLPVVRGYDTPRVVIDGLAAYDMTQEASHTIEGGESE